MKTIAISTLASAFLCAALLSAQAPAAAARPAKTPDLSKYPAAVRATIERETAHAALKGVSKEVEKGKTQYEVETTIDGK
jgi:hypothetical protein